MIGRARKDVFGEKRDTGVMLRIPEDPATYSDNIRPPVPGYPATCDALP